MVGHSGSQVAGGAHARRMVIRFLRCDLRWPHAWKRRQWLEGAETRGAPNAGRSGAREALRRASARSGEYNYEERTRPKRSAEATTHERARAEDGEYGAAASGAERGQGADAAHDIRMIRIRYGWASWV